MCLNNPHIFMLIQKGSREDAIHALMNTWLKDKRRFCGWCGREYDGTPCCEKPFIGTNADILSQFNTEMMATRQTRMNKYACLKDKSMRWKLSFPPGLLQFLETAMDSLYHEKLFTQEHDTTWFAKHFGKYFQVPEEI